MTESPVSSTTVPHPRSRRRRALQLAALLVVGAIVACLLAYRQVQTGAAGRMYTAANVPPQRVAIVFGAFVGPDGEISYPLEVRLRAALSLYRNGRVGKLLVSGDNRWHHYNEPERMKEWLLANGVPEDDVVCDYAGRRTLDTCARAAKIWQLQQVILVTQRYHLPRALYLAEAFGLDAVGVAADGETKQTASRRDRLREVAASVKAWIDVNLLATQPALLGKSESI